MELRKIAKNLAKTLYTISLYVGADVIFLSNKEKTKTTNDMMTKQAELRIQTRGQLE